MLHFVLNLDDPESDKPSKGKPPRKPVDLDAPVEDRPAKGGKADGKIEIVRDPDSTYRNRKRTLTVDRVKEKKRRKVLTSILIVTTVAALAVMAVFLLQRPPTFQDARDAPLPITSTPAVTKGPIQGQNRGPAPVVPNSQPNPLSTLPGLNQEADRGSDSTSGGIH